jgi:hypothetical protein
MKEKERSTENKVAVKGQGKKMLLNCKAQMEPGKLTQKKAAILCDIATATRLGPVQAVVGQHRNLNYVKSGHFPPDRLRRVGQFHVGP